MSIWTSLEPASATVDAGASTTVTLRLRNTGDVVEEYRIALVGDPALWARAEPATLKLYPGTSGTIELTFTPPRTPDATAGPHPFGVQVLPAEQPEATVVVEGILSVTPFTVLYAELIPPVCRGRLRGRPRLALDNLGNTPVTASLVGRDQGDRLDFDLQPSSVQIAPGRAAFSKVTMRSKQLRWTGGKDSLPFTVSVQRSGVEPTTVDGTYVQRALLPAWTLRFLAGLAALTAAAVAFWMLARPTVASRAKEVAAVVSPQEVASAAASAPAALPAPVPGQPTDNPAAPAPGNAPAPPGGTPQKPVGGGGTSGGPGGGGPLPVAPPAGGGGGGGAKPPAPPTLPITASNTTTPNLFVQYAQERLKNLSAGNRCKLTAAVTTGMMDQPTVDKIYCFQHDTDIPSDRLGNIENSDPHGGIGRSTLTALIMYDVIGSQGNVAAGRTTFENAYANAAYRWADQDSLSQTDLDFETNFIHQALNFLAGRAPRPVADYNGNAMRQYAKDVNPKSGKDGTTQIVNALIGGWVKDFTQPGTVAAGAWPGPYAG